MILWNAVFEQNSQGLLKVHKMKWFDSTSLAMSFSLLFGLDARLQTLSARRLTVLLSTVFMSGFYTAACADQSWNSGEKVRFTISRTVCACMCLYVCACMCLYVLVCACMCLYVCACMCLYVCACMCLYVCACMCVLECACCRAASISEQSEANDRIPFEILLYIFLHLMQADATGAQA